MTDHDTPADDALHGTADQVDPGMGGDDRSTAGDGTQHAPGVAFWMTMALG